MVSPVPAVVASVLAAGLWPLLILVLAVVTVTVVALLRADPRDIPAVFGAFARAFGFHSVDEREDPRDTERVAPGEETEQHDEAA